MKRRDAIKTLMLATGGVFVLPSWATGWKAGEMAAYNSTFSAAELKLISAIADTIIPSDGTIGALTVGVDKFLAGLISRCYEKEFREDVKVNLHILDRSAKNAYAKSFSECEKSQREELLIAMANSDDENDTSFFNFMKSQTIRGFETSREVMLYYHNYDMMPGFYDGNVDVNT